MQQGEVYSHEIVCLYPETNTIQDTPRHDQDTLTRQTVQGEIRMRSAVAAVNRERGRVWKTVECSCVEWVTLWSS